MRRSSRASTARARRRRIASPQRWVVMALDRRTGPDDLAADGVRGRAAREAAHQGDLRQRHAGHRRPTSWSRSSGRRASTRSTWTAACVWKKDLGVLNTGAYDLPEYEWGTASSPIIYKDLVIVQCDTQNESFVLAADIDTGEHGVEDGPQGAAVVGNADRLSSPSAAARRARHQRVEFHPRLRSRHRRRALAPRRQLEDHRADAGLHRATSSSSPAAARRSGRSSRSSPAHAATSRLRPDADVERARRLAQDRPRLVHADAAHLRRTRLRARQPGLLRCLRSATGAEIYRQRLPHDGSGFSASPVAADGRIYLSSEDGDIFVVRSGRTFELLAKNPMGEPLMATPALAGGTMYVRGERHLFAIGRK